MWIKKRLKTFLQLELIYDYNQRILSRDLQYDQVPD